MEAEEIRNLIDKYLAGEADPAETTLVEDWYEKINIGHNVNLTHRVDEYKQLTHQAVLTYITDNNADEVVAIDKKKYKILIYRWLSAAMFILSLGTGIYFYQKKSLTTGVVSIKKTLINDVAPGGNKAILTLADGRKIALADIKNGKLATQGGVTINKTIDGNIVYKSIHGVGSREENSLGYNNISTPVGGTYHMVLADGTKIWLNAASSIKYPVEFNGNERLVELTGEAYFEVAKNKHMPFKVICGGQSVEVLGTHFNINCYPNEPAVKTTLFEGSVKVSIKGSSAMLKPGEQSSFVAASGGGALKVSKNISLNEVLAWKNSKFLFAGADIQTVMRQLERWYDVEAIYEGNAPTDHFYGKVPKNVNLSQVLRVLELSGVNFKIEGRKILIH